MSSSTEAEQQTSGERFRVDGASGALVAGRCDNCRNLAWPMPRLCMKCGSSTVHPESLPREGAVETWTRVWIPVAGIDPPYFIARVRLGECRVYGRVVVGDLAEVDVGDVVSLRTATGDLESSRLQYWFELSERDTSDGDINAKENR